MSASAIALTGSFLHCLDDPKTAGQDVVEYIDNGVMVIDSGRISALGPATTVKIPSGAKQLNYAGKLIVPGFIDTHVHFPQVDVIASYGTQLLDWLERYTFPAEAKFHDKAHAADTAEFFLEQLLANGTTTALVFGTVHKASIDAFFTAAAKRSLRMICGKVMMDRNAPDELCDTPETAYTDSAELIRTWHGKQRLGYAVTPRFAPTSSEAQLKVATQLLDEHPTVHLHTHLSENHDECAWVSELFPDCKDYLGVYEKFSLVRRRSVFAHSLHLSTREWKALAQANASIAHCPTSNLFIGSGLFKLNEADKHNVRVGLGTDIGGGDSFSLLRTINEAYKVQQLQQVSLSPERALYLATLGGARALDLDAEIGSFAIGKEADMVVLDDSATSLTARRAKTVKDWRERLFMLMMLGDDRSVFETLVLGQPVKRH